MNSFFPDAVASWNLFMEIFNYKDVPSMGMILYLMRQGSISSSSISFSIESKFKSQMVVQLH